MIVTQAAPDGALLIATLSRSQQKGRVISLFISDAQLGVHRLCERLSALQQEAARHREEIAAQQTALAAALEQLLQRPVVGFVHRLTKGKDMERIGDLSVL